MEKNIKKHKSFNEKNDIKNNSIKNNSKKISALVDEVNFWGRCANSKGDLVINPETGITNEGKLLSSIKELFQTYAKDNGLKLNTGILLNISLIVQKIIKEHNLQLVYNEKTGQITTDDKGDAKINPALEIHAYNSKHPEENRMFFKTFQKEVSLTSLEMNNNTICGQNLNSENCALYDVVVDFNEDGSLYHANYQYNIMPEPQEDWDYQILGIFLETFYYENGYGINSWVTKEKTKVIDSNIHSHRYKNNFEKFIPKIPGLISMNKRKEGICITEINGKMLEIVFPEIITPNNGKIRKLEK